MTSSKSGWWVFLYPLVSETNDSAEAFHEKPTPNRLDQIGCHATVQRLDKLRLQIKWGEEDIVAKSYINLVQIFYYF